MRKSLISNILIGIVILVFIVIGYLLLSDTDGPKIAVTPTVDKVSPNTVLKISLEDPSGVRLLSIGARNGSDFVPFMEKTFDSPQTSCTVEVPLKNLPIKSGSFDLAVRALDASWGGFGKGNASTLYMPVCIDDIPPRITVTTLPPVVRQGGSAVVRYTVDEDVRETGVKIAGYFVPSYRQGDGAYVCIYPFPYTMTPQNYKRSVTLFAVDKAGNKTEQNLALSAFERQFKNDKITVSDDFLLKVKAKMGRFAPSEPDPLKCYLTINSKLRGENMEKLRTLSKKSSSTKLWSGAFATLPRAARRAGFADHRTLVYNGRPVGEASHLGIDLASLRNAAIPAANDGRVIFAGEIGIYGNVTLIDHGLGLLSLYSHMNDFLVREGDLVKKGDCIGHTGSTGLAFGDHLHFGIVVGGIEVTPVEWIDPKWVAIQNAALGAK